MVTFFFFDGGMIFTVIAMLVLAAVGLLEEALPVINVILWILFAISCGFGAYLILFDEDTKASRKVINFIVGAIGYLFTGIVLASYLSSMNTASSMGGFDGLFEFIGVSIFGTLELLIVSFGLMFSTLTLADPEGNLPYGLRLVIAIGALVLVGMIWIF